MNIPDLNATVANMKNCLLLKADDLYFTIGGAEGERFRNEFMGIEIEGLADENVGDEDRARIDLTRFGIWRRVVDLHEMLTRRALSVGNPNIPDSEDARHDALEFLEHFLSTLPNVAMGGWDMTGEARGQVRDVYILSHAWLDLVDAIGGAFNGDDDCQLTISDLSHLTGLDRRTVHNRCGRNKEIRTSVERFALKGRQAVEPAFVRVHPFDAIAWLCGRPSFTIQSIDRDWMLKRFADIDEWDSANAAATQTRAALIAALVNGSKLTDLASRLGVTPDDCRGWYDLGTKLSATARAELSAILNVTLNEI